MTDLPYTVASLFAGCGGLDLGFSNAGFNIVWANEIDKDACKTYKHFFGHEPCQDDISKIHEEVPQADVVIGGPPCQSFSLVGKRLEDDPRGKLPLVYLDIIARTKPKIFVMENVPGLLASRYNDQRLHLYLTDKFFELGYNCQVLKLVATDFGVPQLRKRVFIVGKKDSPLFNFQIPTGAAFSEIAFGSSKQKFPISVSEAFDDLPDAVLKNEEAPIYTEQPHSKYASYLRKENPEKATLHYIPTMSKLDREFVRHIPPGGNYMDIPDSISTTRIMKFKQSGGRTTTYGRLHPERPSYTVNTYFNRPNVGTNYHHKEERLITPREALRLQSFPDHFTPIFSSQRSLCKQIGNAVPPLLARAIAEGVMGALK